MKALGLVVSYKKIFHVFPTSDYVKHVTPRVGPFFAPWLNFNKLGRGLLVDATYQISRLYAMWFQTRIFFHVFPISAYVQHVILGLGPFLAPGA